MAVKNTRNDKSQARKRRISEVRNKEEPHAYTKRQRRLYEDKGDVSEHKGDTDQNASPLKTTNDQQIQKVEEEERADESKTIDTRPHQRFIVFIGNLPYTTTDAALKAHFAKIKPSSVRHRTEKGTNKSKGYAFLEFDAFDRMNTCLKLYHHSLFDDGKGGKPRKLNVELTAGGGGSKSEARKEKLKAKNQKLNQQRKRKAKQEALERAKQKHETAGNRSGIQDKDKSSSNIQPRELQSEVLSIDPGGAVADSGNIHPSRRKLMKST